MQTDAQKLQAVEGSLRRWHSRLTRATNAIGKLRKKRERLMKAVYVPKAVSEIPLPELDAFFMPDKPKALVPHDDLAALPSNQPVRPRAHVRLANMAEDMGPAIREAREDMGIPACLDRSNPQIEEAAVTARKAAEAAERVAQAKKKMPLTGRAALDAIRSKPRVRLRTKGGDK